MKRDKRNKVASRWNRIQEREREKERERDKQSIIKWKTQRQWICAICYMLTKIGTIYKQWEREKERERYKEKEKDK